MADAVVKTELVQNGQVKRYEVCSFTNPNKTYIVSLYRDGTWKCSCPHWIFRCQKAKKHCKHIIYCEDLGSHPMTRAAVVTELNEDDLTIEVEGYVIRRLF